MRGDALETFKNISSPNRENLVEILILFRRKNVKPQSMATAKHKFQRPKTGLKYSESEVTWFFGRTPGISKRRVWNCCPNN